MARWPHMSLALGLAAMLPVLHADAAVQRELGARDAVKIEADGLWFKDLNANGALDIYEDWRAPTDARVDDLLGRMSLAQKAGLMVHPGHGMGEGGALAEDSERRWPGSDTPQILPGSAEILGHRYVRHVLTRSDEAPDILATWNNNIQAFAEGEPLGIPITISSDPRNHFRHSPEAHSVRAGEFSQWPEPIGLAATHDPELVRRFAEIAAQEYRAVGIRTALHPMADLATEPRWGRIAGTFGEDAEMSAKMTAAYVRGFQGEDGLSPGSVITMTKHFPGGGPQLDGFDPHMEHGREQAYPGDNLAYHLIPFRAAIEAKTAQIMPYYGIPVGITSKPVGMAFSPEIITDLLRDDLGFDGVVCSDWGITSMMAWGVEDLSVEERHAKALDAGIDQFGGADDPSVIAGLVETGRITEARLDESVRRLLRDKFLIGLFEDPYVDASTAMDAVGNEQSTAAAEEAQRKSVVLLSNRGSADGMKLPLAQGLKLYVEDVTPEAAARYGDVVETPAEADVAILRVKTPFEPGEGFFASFIHEGNLAFEGAELERIRAVMRARPTVVVAYLERPAVLTDIVADAAAVLGTFGAGDGAVLDVIFGEFAPSGKLPFELPRSMEAVEAQFEDVPYDSVDPLFPFGFGLTY